MLGCSSLRRPQAKLKLQGPARRRRAASEARRFVPGATRRGPDQPNRPLPDPVRNFHLMVMQVSPDGKSRRRVAIESHRRRPSRSLSRRGIRDKAHARVSIIEAR